MNYKHFILTRFNIPFKSEVNIEQLTENNYLEKRFKLFFDFSFSSILNQSRQNYFWFVFFDSRTPLKYKLLNKKLQNILPAYFPIYVDFSELSNLKCDDTYIREAIRCASLARNSYIAEDSSNLNYEDFTSRVLIPQYINNLIRQHIDPDTKYVITTRIDNDDCFETDMIKCVQEQALKVNLDKILNFDNGLQYIANKNICQTFFYPNNHFTSIIEPVNRPIKTILYWEHYFIDRYKEVIHIDTKPLWMEVIHDNNAVNSLKLGRENRLMWNVDLQPFGTSKRWNYVATLAALMIHPTAYFWPHIKKALHLSKLKRLLKCHLS